MKLVSGILSAAGLALMLTGIPAAAQQKQPAPAPSAAPAKQGSPAAHRRRQGNPGDEKRRRDVQQRRSQYRAADQAGAAEANLNYQKDLDEVAVVVAQKLAGREKEIGDGMAAVYVSEFSEQELKDLVVFYKSPLGQKLLLAEPKAISQSMAFMNQWAQSFAEIVNGEFRAEMRKRGKQI